MFVINPPFELAGTLATVLPWLMELLAQDEGAGHSVEQREL
jgi:23S rRNA A2030 N6-methylase RlmJ